MKNTKENILQQHDSSLEIQPGSIIIGRLVDLDHQGRPLVDYDINPENHPQAAITTQSLTHLHVSRQVALLFNNGDLLQPVIMGLIHNPLDELLENFELTAAAVNDARVSNPGEQEQTDVTIEDVNVDGKRVVIEAQHEIVLKCGDASITLTKAGKILIRGKYLLNRSTGVNRIMGGSVQVN